MLGATAWYRSQPQPVRARIGLHMVATFMKIGLEFEGVLKRGLLEFAANLPNGAPEFRYAYHEVIEEAQHSLMFQEFVNRTGFDTPGLTRVAAIPGAQPRDPTRAHGSRSCSSSSCSAARTRSTTCSAPRCAADARSIRSCAASCRSTSPRRRATSVSRATT